jgi:hypothetical protein
MDKLKSPFEADKKKLATEKYKLAKQLSALKTLAESCIALETNALSYFHLPTDLLKIAANGDELVAAVEKISADFSDALKRRTAPYDGMKGDVEKAAAVLKSAIRLKRIDEPPREVSPEVAKSVFFQHLATLLKIIKLAEESTYDDMAREAAKLPLRHRFPCRISTLIGLAAVILLLAVAGACWLSGGNKESTTAPDAARGLEKGKNPTDEHKIEKSELPALTVLVNPQMITIASADSKSSDPSAAKTDQKNPPAGTSGAAEGKGSNDEHKGAALKSIALLVVGISAFLATLWAMQSYWRLAIVDQEDKRWRPPETDSDWSGPYAFHSLAQSHKEWAQLWFSWCVAIFLGGVSYAVYNSTHDVPKPDGHWTAILLTMLNSYLHHALVYTLFGFAWYWASKHYRSHWHNYVANAYRHRSLYRFEMLRREIPTRMMGAPAEYKDEANKTILELFRLSGILLLIPGESSYLDKPAGEEVSKAILRMEEVANAFSHRGEGGGKH